MNRESPFRFFSETLAARCRGAAAIVVVVCCATALAPGLARADASTVDCPTASEQGQRLRDEGRYLRAREMFRECARDACPGVVRKDCTKWLSAIDDSMPTLVVSARDADGRDVGEGRLLIDGEVVMPKLDGKPVTVDPGERTLRFEAPGSAPIELKIIVQVGEKNRLVRLKVEPVKAATPTTPQKTETPATKQGEVTQKASPDSPIAAIAVAGVGALALGGFAFFGVTGKGDLNQLKTTCAPYCAQEDLDSAKTKLTIADISLAVGVVSLAAATVLFITGSSTKASTRIDVRPTSGGATLGLFRAF